MRIKHKIKEQKHKSLWFKKEKCVKFQIQDNLKKM